MDHATRVRGARGGDGWCVPEVDSEADLTCALQAAPRQFLDSIDSNEALVELDERIWREFGNVRSGESAACLLAFTDRISEGTIVIDELLTRLDDSIPWRLELRRRMERLRASFSHGESATHALLAEWQAVTESALSSKRFGRRAKKRS